MKQLFFLPAIFLLATACSGPGRGDAPALPESFFDLKGYMQAEIQRLSEAQPRVLKRIAINGQSEEKNFDSLNYQKELDIFSRSDINKMAWLDKYKVDSTFQDGQLSRVTYTAQDKSLKTHLLEVQFSNGQVAGIHVRNQTESIVANVGQDMWYAPGKGYRLESGQSTALTKEKKVAVEVEFQ